MEETAEVIRRASMMRFAPALVVLITAAGFTFAAIASNMGIAYLAWDSRAYHEALGSADPYARAAVGVVPIACLLALPVIWFNGLSLLLGTAALLETRPAAAGAPARRVSHPVTV